MATSTFVCPLCGLAPTAPNKRSIEHVTPATRFRPGGMYHGKDFVASKPLEKGEVKNPSQFRQRLPICGNCNAWSNSQFENAAMPIMRELEAGGARTLSADDMTVLARYATKDMVMQSLWGTAYMGDPEVFTRAELDTFRATGEPFDDSTVHLASLHYMITPFGPPPGQFAITPGDQQIELAPGSAVFTWQRGEVTTFIIRHKGVIAGTTEYDPIATVTETGIGLMACPRIWPLPDESVDWPPLARMDLNHLTIMASAFAVPPFEGLNFHYGWVAPGEDS